MTDKKEVEGMEQINFFDQSEEWLKNNPGNLCIIFMFLIIMCCGGLWNFTGMCWGGLFLFITGMIITAIIKITKDAGKNRGSRY